MEALLEEHEKLSRDGNFSESVEDVQKTIDLLVKARDSIAASTFCSVPWFSWVGACDTCSLLLSRPQQCFSDTSKAPESRHGISPGHHQRPEGCLQRTEQLFKSVG